MEDEQVGLFLENFKNVLEVNTNAIKQLLAEIEELRERLKNRKCQGCDKSPEQCTCWGWLYGQECGAEEEKRRKISKTEWVAAVQADIAAEKKRVKELKRENQEFAALEKQHTEQIVEMGTQIEDLEEEVGAAKLLWVDVQNARKRLWKENQKLKICLECLSALVIAQNPETWEYYLQDVKKLLEEGK